MCYQKIKPLGEWLNPERGGILETRYSFVSLNVVLSSFGHVLVAPKREGIYRATNLTPRELIDLERAKEIGLARLKFLITGGAQQILRVYETWIADPKITERLPNSKPRMEAAIREFEESGSIVGVPVFENIGDSAGQVVKHYHLQIVPQYRRDLNGGGEALFQYTKKRLNSIQGNVQKSYLL